VARVLAAIVTPFAQIGVVMEPREVNGQPVINPDKLGHVGRCVH
jgi:hypothetical protein